MTTPMEAVKQVAPKMAEMSELILYGDIWERPQLSKRDRSLITIASLISMYRTGQLTGHITRGLDNGLTREEIREIITHMAFYAGWPASAQASIIASQVYNSQYDS